MTHSPEAIAITAIGVLFTIIGAVLSLRIYRYTRMRRGWLAVTIALFLLAVEHLLDLSVVLDFIPHQEHGIGAIVFAALPLLIAITLTVGLFSLLKEFRRFGDIADRVVTALRTKKKRR
ncbi:hypothetical protein HY493_00735 [Candidatus Woesearchaeota archaeon]|nr:hypothetical protein [Candidatus Woesearchaeota archaeon]